MKQEMEERWKQESSTRRQVLDLFVSSGDMQIKTVLMVVDLREYAGAGAFLLLWDSNVLRSRPSS